MSGPVRVQLRRAKGWRMPPNTVSVARPGKWGNPFKPGVTVCGGRGFSFSARTIDNNTQAVEAFKTMLEQPLRAYPTGGEVELHLRGKNLACWCKLDQPCHADVLLELANAKEQG